MAGGSSNAPAARGACSVCAQCAASFRRADCPDRRVNPRVGLDDPGIDRRNRRAYRRPRSDTRGAYIGNRNRSDHDRARMERGKIRAYRLADNKLAELSSWDAELLGLELSELRDLGASVELTGFDAASIETLIAGPKAPDSFGNYDGRSKPSTSAEVRASGGAARRGRRGPRRKRMSSARIWAERSSGLYPFAGRRARRFPGIAHLCADITNHPSRTIDALPRTRIIIEHGPMPGATA